MAQPQAVPISQLALPQLEALKSQVEQEVDFFSSSMQQLKIAQNKLRVSKESLKMINKDTADKEILVPLTSSMYVPGQLSNVNHVIVDIGTGYYVQKTVEEAVAYFQRKVEFIGEQKDKVQPMLQEKVMMRRAVVEIFNTKLQQQMAALSTKPSTQNV
uniref:prefoldin subunit 5 n=1 Tax=Myxine glutinosa TaxID=7769 RepID=UPI00358F0B62